MSMFVSSTAPGAANAVYSLSSHDILRISLGAQVRYYLVRHLRTI